MDEKPETGRRLLAALKASQTQEAGNRLADIVGSVAKLGELIVEAAHPSRLITTTTSLEETWAKVGGFVQFGIEETEKKHQRAHD